MPILREIITRFGFDFDEKSADKADQAIEGLTDGAKGLVAAISAGAAARAAFNLVDSFTMAADAVSKTAERIGVTTEALQELRFAAELAGISQQEFDGNLERFVRRLGEAADGTGEAVDAYRKLGVELRDQQGNLRPSEAVFTDVAQAISQIPDTATQAAVASDIFGRSGVRMLTLLRGGAGGIAKARAELQEFGGVLDKDLIGASVEWRDTLTRISAAVTGLRARLVRLLLPAFQKIGSAVISASKRLAGLLENTRILEVALVSIVSILGLLTFVAGFKLLSSFGALTVVVLKMAAGFSTAGAAALVAQAKMALMGIGVLAAIALVLLLIEDLVVFFDGGTSGIGKLLDLWDSFVTSWATQPLAPDAHWLAIFFKWAAQKWKEWETLVADAFDFFTDENISILRELQMLWQDFFTVPIKRWLDQISGFIGKAAGLIRSVPGLQSILGGALGPIGAAIDVGARAGSALSGLSAPQTQFIGNTGNGGARNTVNSTINVQQQPGESGEALARRIVDEQIRQGIISEIDNATAALTPQVAAG